MHIHILSVGKSKAGPEKNLAEDYAARFSKIGRPLGLRSLTLIEVDSGGGLDAEAARLLSRLPQGAKAWRLDEHGPAFSSVEFATRIAALRDQGTGHLAFLVGGAEGYSASLCAALPDTLAFGPQTWPHRLVRVMLCEQLYRAASLIAGLPYHKP